MLDDGRGLAATIRSMKNDLGHEAFHLAAIDGQTVACKYLVEEIKLDINSNKDETTIYLAILHGKHKITSYLFHRAPIMLSRTNRDNCSASCHRKRYGHLPGWASSLETQTPLMRWSRRGAGLGLLPLPSLPSTPPLPMKIPAKKNQLSGLRKAYLKLSFDTVQRLMHVRNDLMHVVERNQAKSDAAEAFESIYNAKSKERPEDCTDCITDVREYDVPYHVYLAIDNDVRCGQWYDINVSSAGILLEKRADLLQHAEVHVCAFDIETAKLPLKFLDAEYDLIMMISYMIDGQG